MSANPMYYYDMSQKAWVQMRPLHPRNDGSVVEWQDWENYGIDGKGNLKKIASTHGFNLLIYTLHSLKNWGNKSTWSKKGHEKYSFKVAAINAFDFIAQKVLRKLKIAKFSLLSPKHSES